MRTGITSHSQHLTSLSISLLPEVSHELKEYLSIFQM